MLNKTIIHNGATINYSLAGSGPRVILLHGFGETGNIWQHQIDFLKSNFQLIVPDLPGSGQSQFIPDADIDTYAEILKKILDAEVSSMFSAAGPSEKINQIKASITLIGHSMGGYIALAFAKKYPTYLSAIGLVHSSAFADSEEKKLIRKKSIDFISSNGSFAFLKCTIPSLFSKKFLEENSQQVEALIQDGKNFTKEALIQYYTAMCNRRDSREMIEKFNGPILFLIGEQDVAIPLQINLEQCHLPMRSHVTILPLAAHMGIWEEAEKTNKILFTFLHSF